MALTKIRNRMIADAPAQVTDFGASTALADNTAAFQAALNTGLDVKIPPGDWRMVGPITLTTNGQMLIGSGSDTNILSTSTINDVIRVGSGAQINGVVVRNLNIYSTVKKTAGAAVRIRAALRCDVVECAIPSFEHYAINGGANGGTRLYDGIVYEACGDCDISDIDMWGLGRDAIRVNGDVNFNAELSIRGARIAHAERYGVYCGGGFGGLSLDEGAISACWRNVCIDKVITNTPNREIFISGQFSIDAASDCNVWIGPQAVSILEFNSCWIASAGHTTGIGPSQSGMEGIHVDPDNANLTMRITGGKIFNNKGWGIVVNGGQVIIDGVHIVSNGVGMGASGHGIWVVASDGNNGPFQISDCNFSGNTGYDIRFDTSSPTALMVTDNIFRSTGPGTFSAPSLSTSENIVVQRNIGYRTQSSGAGAVASGTSSVTVSHGLAGTPTCVQVTPFNTIPEGGTFSVQSVNATTFTVSIGSNAAANRDFFWTANLGAQI
jgi:hypothetical protein